MNYLITVVPEAQETCVDRLLFTETLSIRGLNTAGYKD